jgi:hypothetical protein
MDRIMNRFSDAYRPVGATLAVVQSRLQGWNVGVRKAHVYNFCLLLRHQRKTALSPAERGKASGFTGSIAELRAD